jgi:hypothetical protein
MILASIGYMDLATGLVLLGLGIGAGIKVQMTHKSEFALVQIAFTLGYGLIYIARYINSAVSDYSITSEIRYDKLRIALDSLFFMLAV